PGRGWGRTATYEERPLLRLLQFNPQPFRRDAELHLVLKILELGHAAHGLFDYLLQIAHVVLVHYRTLSRVRVARAQRGRKPPRIAKISGDRLLRLIARVRHPQYDEERHHRGHEIRVRHLPRPAVPALG